jgi:hypothetical protein
MQKFNDVLTLKVEYLVAQSTEITVNKYKLNSRILMTIYLFAWYFRSSTNDSFSSS